MALLPIYTSYLSQFCNLNNQYLKCRQSESGMGATCALVLLAQLKKMQLSDYSLCCVTIFSIQTSNHLS